MKKWVTLGIKGFALAKIGHTCKKGSLLGQRVKHKKSGSHLH